MKYKNIKSVLHNFGHSFFSLMNYVEDEYVVDVVAKMIKEIDTHELRIYFPEEKVSPSVNCPEMLKK
jgi:hypothetical protein